MSSKKAGEQNPNAKLKLKLGEIWRRHQEINSLCNQAGRLLDEVMRLEKEVDNCHQGAYVGFHDPFEPTVVAVIEKNGISFWGLTNLAEEEDDISR